MGLKGQDNHVYVTDDDGLRMLKIARRAEAFQDGLCTLVRDISQAEIRSQAMHGLIPADGWQHWHFQPS
jgi:hypothetical protein